MKRSISTLNENNNNDYSNSKNNNSEIYIKKPKNENLYSCNLQQNNNGMMSTENLKTQIDNNAFDNNMDDLEISFSKFCEENNDSIKIMMGDTRQKKEDDYKIINGNYCFFFNGNLEYNRNSFYNKN